MEDTFSATEKWTPIGYATPFTTHIIIITCSMFSHLQYVMQSLLFALCKHTSPNMKISTPLLRIAREISPYLGSMARINLKEN